MNTVRNNDLRFFAKEVKRRCADEGIALKFVKGLDTAKTDGKTIFVPQLTPPISYEDFMYTRYFVLHEIGHHLRPHTFTKLKSAGRLNENTFGVWNCVEDELQEREVAMKYRGDHATLVKGRRIHVARMIQNAIDDMRAAQVHDVDEDCAKRVAVYAMCNTTRDYHPGAKDMADNIIRAFGNGLARQWFDILMSEGWDTMLDPKMDVHAGFDYSMDLARRLWGDDAAEQQAPGEGDAQEGEGNPQQNGEGNGEGNQGDTDDDGAEAQQNSSQERNTEDGDGDDTESKGEVTFGWEFFVMDDHSEKQSGVNRGRMTIVYDGWSPDGNTSYYDRDECNILTGKEAHRPSRDGDCGCDPCFTTDMSIANNLRRYIQSLSRTGWDNNKLHGKRINKRALKRTVTGTREYNRKVFQTRKDKQGLDTAITLLVDWSGSMWGESAKIAASGAATLAECFGRVLGCPVEVISHTTHGMRPRFICIKDFDEHVSGDEVHERMAHHYMGGNADGDALLFAYDRIRERKERRKIIIAIADGNPALCKSGWPCEALAQAIKTIRQSKDVELYGIGAAHDNIKIFYGENSQVIWDISEMNRVLLQVATDFVAKGVK